MNYTEEKINDKKIYREKKYGVKRKIVLKNCQICEEQIKIKLSHYKMDDKNRKTCSPECSGKLQAKNTNQEGENNPNWKGGLSEYKYRYKQRQKEKHPKKIRARRMVNSAIQTGKLERGECLKCGKEDDVEAHHTDYDKPLEVEWLCKKHHLEYHNKDISLEEYTG